MEEMVTNDDDERSVMSYKMAILSVVGYDQSHPQHCLDQYLPSAKFQLQTVVTKSCDFLDNKFSSYAAVSQALRVLVVAFRDVDLLVINTSPLQDFLNGKVQAYIFQDGLRRVMAVQGAESESSRFKKSVKSDLGYRTFSCCCLSVLSGCMACLLQYRST